MSKIKQRFSLLIKGRVHESFSAEERHARFFQGIADIPPPWGIGDRAVPPAPDFGKGCAAVVGLKKFFGTGVKQAMITYRYRRLLSDDSHCDDRLMIGIDPEKVDLHHLIYAVIPNYIEAFDAYRVDYFDEEFIHLAYEERVEEGRIVYSPKSKVRVNQRFEVKQVEVVSFYDETLCRRAFNRSPAEVMHRLAGMIEYATLLHNGIYIVGNSTAMPFEDAAELTRKMTAALREDDHGRKGEALR